MSSNEWISTPAPRNFEIIRNKMLKRYYKIIYLHIGDRKDQMKIVMNDSNSKNNSDIIGDNILEVRSYKILSFLANKFIIQTIIATNIE